MKKIIEQLTQTLTDFVFTIKNYREQNLYGRWY